MILNNNFKKYDFLLSAAVSGMKKYTDLQDRCLFITIHLKKKNDYKDLCDKIFNVAEDFFSVHLEKMARVSHTGLLAFVDFNGSRFSRAAIDLTKPHIHAILFFPHGISDQMQSDLIAVLDHAVRSHYLCARSDDSVLIRPYVDAHNSDKYEKGLDNLVAYISRVERESDDEKLLREGYSYGYMLPYDRHTYSPDVREMITVRQSIVLDKLRSPEWFKIVR